MNIHYANSDLFMKKEPSHNCIKNEDNENYTNAIMLSQIAFSRDGKIVKNFITVPQFLMAKKECTVESKSMATVKKGWATDSESEAEECTCSHAQQNEITPKKSAEFIKMVHKTARKPSKRKVKVFNNELNTDTEEFAHAYIDGTVDGIYSKSNKISNGTSASINKTRKLNDSKGPKSKEETVPEERIPTNIENPPQDTPNHSAVVAQNDGNAVIVLQKNKRIYHRKISEDPNSVYNLSITISDYLPH